MAKEKTVREVRPLPVWAAILPILVMACLMIYDLAIEKNYEDAHLPLVVATCVAFAVGVGYGRSFNDRKDQQHARSSPHSYDGRLPRNIVHGRWYYPGSDLLWTEAALA